MATKKTSTRKTAKKTASKKTATSGAKKPAAAKKTRRTKQRWKVGDVFQIDLPDGRYAYGRVYRDSAVGIYRAITDAPGQPPIGSNDFLFNVGMYEDVLDDGKVKIIGSDPFPSEDAAWPPPTFIKDAISGEYSVYHKGVISKSTKKRSAGLEEAAVWEYEHIVNRILAGNNSPEAWRGKEDE